MLMQRGKLLGVCIWNLETGATSQRTKQPESKRQAAKKSATKKPAAKKPTANSQ